MVYEDGSAWRTIHINHVKPAKLTAPDLPLPSPSTEPSRPPLGYLPRSVQKPRPHQPPPPLQSVALAGGDSPPSTASLPTPPAASPPASERSPRDTTPANHNSAPSPRLSSHPASEIQLPTSAPANQNSGSAFRPLRSARLNPELDQVCAIKGPPGTLAPQSQKSPKMARTYPLSIAYNQCLGAKEEPLSFASVCLEDFHNGQLEYLATMKQLVDALPKTENPSSRFALRGLVVHRCQQRLRHSMRAALWWLLPPDREFSRASNSLHYYLARQGRRVVLRWGDVTRPLYENRLNWVVDPAPPASRQPMEETSPASTPAIFVPPSEAPSQPPRGLRSRRRRRRKAARSANRNSASRQADPATPPTRPANENSPRWASSMATQPRSPTRDLTGSQLETRSTPVKHPQSFTSSSLSQHPISAANRNGDRTSCQDHSEIWGLYKPAQLDPSQDLTATRLRDNISGSGLSSPALQLPSTQPFSGLPSRQFMTGPHREAREAG